ncbi:MAG: Hsp70 family protein [Bdellovibrionales bacterium]
MKGKIIYAIDFGTSNSLLAAATADSTGKPIPLDFGHSDPTVMRSTMYFSTRDSVWFGEDAIRTYLIESGEGRFIRSIKKFLPSTNFSSTQIGTKAYTLEDLIGRFLREMKLRADRHFNHDVRSVVLGRPARFSNAQKAEDLAQQRLQRAAAAAGFEEIHFFPEPLAAAFDYRQGLVEEKLVLIVDLGAGTSDFTVIRLKPDSFESDDVLSLGGISVAGDALDGSIMAGKIAPHFGSQVKYRLPMSSNVLTMPADLRFRLSSPADITLMSKSDIMGFLEEVNRCTIDKKDSERLDRLFTLIDENLGFAVFDEIEACKRAVCEGTRGLFQFRHPDIQIQEDLSAEEFEALSEVKIRSIFSTMDQVISASGVCPTDIDLICCTGGTSKVPAVRSHLMRRFGVDKIRTLQSFHSVIQGLAERARDLLRV